MNDLIDPAGRDPGHRPFAVAVRGLMLELAKAEFKPRTHGFRPKR